MTERASITVYGAHWCPDCRRSKQFLGEHQIPYRWVDIEQDKQAELYVQEKNNGKRIIPTIEFSDGFELVCCYSVQNRFGIAVAMKAHSRLTLAKLTVIINHAVGDQGFCTGCV